jgi:hypothetical protein
MSKPIEIQPFIANYASNFQKTKRGNVTLSYYAPLESIIVEPGRQLAIENDLVLQEETGSLITKADGDPTRDESTDR